MSFKLRTQTFGITLLGILFIFSSCTNTQKLIDNGNYDEAIEYATRKLRGKTKKKAKYVAALETGFRKANVRDMKRLNHLRKNAIERPQNWERILDIADQIDERQRLIDPLLPVIDKEGYQANFKFVHTASILSEAKNEAAEVLYKSALAHLKKAEQGIKLAGRFAYRDLDKVSRYKRNYKDVNSLLRKARELGTTHVLLSVKNSAPVVLPAAFEREIKRITVRDMQGRWTEYHTKANENTTIDIRVIMNINDIDVSPERVNERAYVDQKEIQDGYEYLYDENGKAVVDSSGTHIKIPVKRIITAEVIESFQHKTAIVSGNLDFFDPQTKELLRSTPISVETVFENYASTYRGDRRALSSDSKRRIGNSPRPFPSDESLLLEAADRLKPIIKKKIVYVDDLLASS